MSFDFCKQLKTSKYIDFKVIMISPSHEAGYAPEAAGRPKTATPASPHQPLPALT